jgi:hypothetical protein
MIRIIVFLGRDSGAMLAAAALHLSAHPLHASRFWPELDEHTRSPLPPIEHGAVADALLTGSLGGRPRVVITHSDVFVLRLRRHVAEGSLAAADVDLRWVESPDSIRSILLNDRGTPAWWPKGLGAEAQEEFHGIRRALAARDAPLSLDKTARAEQPTLPETT